nr:cytochrome c oxidase subunit 2 [Pherusa bengalensis]
MPFWSQLMLQDAASPIMSQLIALHDHAMLVVVMVLTFVAFMFLVLMTNKLTCRNLLEANQLETIWTIAPAFILIFLALPSLRLLYLMDEITSPQLTIKAIGHQWYWSYEYSDFHQLEFDSYMVPIQDLTPGSHRLLEVDHRAVLPILTEIRMLVSSADVIHSWTVPSLGVKSDAVPGRLNQVGFFISRPGAFYGQCSEICGTDHSFMPIAIEAVNLQTFIAWLKNMKDL